MMPDDVEKGAREVVVRKEGKGWLLLVQDPGAVWYERYVETDAEALELVRGCMTAYLTEDSCVVVRKEN